MKNLIIYSLAFILLACSKEQLIDDLGSRGGFIQFEKIPTTQFNITEKSKFELSANLIDPNKNASKYMLTLFLDKTKVKDFLTITSFPSTLTITSQMILDALKITEKDIVDTTKFSFIATVTTNSGDIFYGAIPPKTGDFDPLKHNLEEIGNMTPRLTRKAMRNAMFFDISFFTPEPPKPKDLVPTKFRYTSFEEPKAIKGEYKKSLGANVTEDLKNHPGEPIVDYVAKGTSIDNELGFDLQWIDKGNSGFRGEVIGVTDDVTIVKSYADGKQGYKVEDGDGLFRLTFDKVAIPEKHSHAGASLQLFFNKTTWESRDLIHVYANVKTSSGNKTIDLIKVSEGKITEKQNNWFKVDTGFIEGAKAITIVADIITSHDLEKVYLDDLTIYVPK